METLRYVSDVRDQPRASQEHKTFCKHPFCLRSPHLHPWYMALTRTMELWLPVAGYSLTSPKAREGDRWLLSLYQTADTTEDPPPHTHIPKCSLAAWLSPTGAGGRNDPGDPPYLSRPTKHLILIKPWQSVDLMKWISLVQVFIY